MGPGLIDYLKSGFVWLYAVRHRTPSDIPAMSGLISCVQISGSVVSSPGMAGNFLMIESYVTSTMPVASAENTRLIG